MVDTPSREVPHESTSPHASSAERPAPQAPNPQRRSLPSRLLPKITLGVLAFAAVVVLAELAIGAVATSALRHLGLAALLGGASCLVWELIERQLRSVESGLRDAPGASAWVAFPLALLLFFGQVPLLALAVFPPIAEFFERNGRVEAQAVLLPEGERLEIRFPRPVRPTGNNLRVNGRFVPPELLAEDAGVARWRGPRTLSLSVPALREALELGPLETLGVNVDLQEIRGREAAWPFVFEDDGAKVPHQQIRLDGAR